jgi:hypothetical protein
LQTQKKSWKTLKEREKKILQKKEGKTEQKRRKEKESSPIKGTFGPLVDESHGQHTEKDHHHIKPKDSCVTERKSPREKEGNLQIKDNEKDGDQVKLNIKPASSIIKGLEPTLIGSFSINVCSSRLTHKKGGSKNSKGKNSGNQEKNKNRTKIHKKDEKKERKKQKGRLFHLLPFSQAGKSIHPFPEG